MTSLHYLFTIFLLSIGLQLGACQCAPPDEDFSMLSYQYNAVIVEVEFICLEPEVHQENSFDDFEKRLEEAATNYLPRPLSPVAFDSSYVYSVLVRRVLKGHITSDKLKLKTSMSGASCGWSSYAEVGDREILYLPEAITNDSVSFHAITICDRTTREQDRRYRYELGILVALADAKDGIIEELQFWRYCLEKT